MRTLTGHGVPNTAVRAARVIAVSIHSSNAKLRSRGLADFACAIHFQVMQAHRKGVIGGDLRVKRFICPNSGDMILMRSCFVLDCESLIISVIP